MANETKYPDGWENKPFKPFEGRASGDAHTILLGRTVAALEYGVAQLYHIRRALEKSGK